MSSLKESETTTHDLSDWLVQCSVLYRQDCMKGRLIGTGFHNMRNFPFSDRMGPVIGCYLILTLMYNNWGKLLIVLQSFFFFFFTEKLQSLMVLFQTE